MNDAARKHIESALISLEEAKNCLGKASSNAENGTIKERIENQLDSISGCLDECENIASGLAQK